MKTDTNTYRGTSVIKIISLIGFEKLSTYIKFKSNIKDQNDLQ